MSRVLVVNDEPELAETCKLVLEIHGHEVATHQSLSGLRELLHDFQPEVIVLDWNVGTHTGDEALPMVRSELPASPVIVITASTGIEKQARRLGASSLLGKPFDVDALTGEVSKVSNQKN